MMWQGNYSKSYKECRTEKRMNKSASALHTSDKHWRPGKKKSDLRLQLTGRSDLERVGAELDVTTISRTYPQDLNL